MVLALRCLVFSLGGCFSAADFGGYVHRMLSRSLAEAVGPIKVGGHVSIWACYAAMASFEPPRGHSLGDGPGVVLGPNVFGCSPAKEVLANSWDR
jgi:hypothetical protein